MAHHSSGGVGCRVWHWLAIVAAVSAWIGCDSAESPPEAVRPIPKDASSEADALGADGHERMIRALAELARRTRTSATPFFGEETVTELEQQLTRLPGDAPSEMRYSIVVALAQRELHRGNVETAIELHLEAERLFSAFEYPSARERTAQNYRLGVAYLRLGEVRNCAVMHNADRCLFPIRGEGVHKLREGSRKALRYLDLVLEDGTTDRLVKLKARWLLNVAFMTLGAYPDDVPKEHLIRQRFFSSDEPFPRFLDVAPKLGLNEMTVAGGALAEDFDGDGYLDLMVSEWSPWGQLRYYHNDGDGTFSDETERSGLTGLTGGLNLKQADYDNDGDADVLVPRGAWFETWGRHPNSLIRNNGDGTFTDVTIQAGLAGVDLPTQSVGWSDYDNDGDVDLYIGNESDATIRAPSQLFRNNGDDTFTNVAAQAGVENFRYSKGVAWGDYDGDRFPDLYVSNMGQPNRLYRNNRDGTFTDVAGDLGIEDPIRSFSVWFWDFDNDGVLDLYVTSYEGQLAEVVASYLWLGSRVPPAKLYRGTGGGGFEDVAASQNLTSVHMPMGSNYGDLDNDGFLDFYLGTGYAHYEGLMPNVMYRNRGGTGFSNVTVAGGFGHLQKGHGIAFADFDNDGDQDVFAQMGGAFPGDAFMNALFENPGFGNHWLKLKLVGVRSNRAAIGARLRLGVIENGQRRSIFREVSTGSSFGSNPLLQEIGVGSAEEIEVLEVFWPTTGETQRFEKVAVDQALEIVEGSSTYRALPLKAVSFVDGGAKQHAKHDAVR